jgi:organic radical activating enzyme
MQTLEGLKRRIKTTTSLKDIVSSNVELVVQPVSPMSIWDNKKKLFTISEIIGKEFKVSIIPQIHKYMDIE